MKINHVFPTCVGFSRLPKQLTEAQLKFIAAQPTKANEGNLGSVGVYILDNEELVDLRDGILKEVRQYFQEVFAPSKDVDVYITQSWLNITAPKQYHHLHSHPNSFLSGVFYISAEHGKDQIRFHRSYTGTNIKLEPTQWNEHNSQSWWYPVSTGDLVIFPSSLVHDVPPTTSTKPRVSLAFNVFLRGRIGSADERSELKLS